ncbi:hypothetical protein LCGC14_1715880 [marine sediment metagenome]|uniref:Uncharacterized protein n=1 Tax=marine sediment metagenome TaxID=412755 RepID=A0A0F9KDU0_9ZZZZ
MAEPINITHQERFDVVASENAMLRIEVKMRMDREDVMLRRIKELERDIATLMAATVTPPNRAERRRKKESKPS